MTGAKLPDTPAGTAAAWVMDAVGRADELTDGELEDRFHPGFLQSIPPKAVRQFLGKVGDSVAGGEVAAVEARASEVDWLVPVGKAEAPLHFHVAVHQAEPHRIHGLRVAPFDEATTVKVPPAETRRDQDSLPATSAETVDRFVSDAVERLGLVGLHVTVVHPGGAHHVHHAHRGWAHIDDRVEWSPTTSHRVGSVAKTFTAAAVVHMARAGLFDLDDDVDGLLTEIDVPAGVTVRHLLTHTGGIDADAGTGIEGDVNPLTLPELLAEGVRSVHPPGELRGYSNLGYGLLGQVVEDVSGTPFAAHVEADLFLPLGMESTVFGERDDARTSLATGYSVHFGRAVLEPWVAITMPAAGAALSTPADMSHWMAALMSEVGLPLLEPQTDLVPDGSQALGLRLLERGGHRLAWHNGGWPGWSTSVGVAPDDHWGVYLCTNTGNRTGGGDDLDEAGGRLLLELMGGGG